MKERLGSESVYQQKCIDNNKQKEIVENENDDEKKTNEGRQFKKTLRKIITTNQSI